ncbi:MAG TPA: amino acid adenylation domain-containing protein [Pyrinomonadaceae bacterium]|nr:amino acid adenylation domain-containing protein [Pyrinomonadaceae bacterium]
MSVTNDTLAQRRAELAARRAALSTQKQEVLDALLKQGGEGVVPARVIPVCPPDVSALLSFAQERLWFLDQLEPGTTAYNICVPFRITGRLNVCALAQSVNEMIRRQEALRTTFVAVDGKPVQLLSPWSNQDLPVVDLASLPAPDDVVQQLIADAGNRSFDLANGPLVRTNLIKLAGEDHLLLLTLHHISLDEWSMRILLHDTAQIYKAFAQGEPSPLGELPIQYRDFAHWQRQWLQGDVLAAELEYWRQQLDGSPPVLALPTDRPRSSVTSWKAETVTFELSPELSAALNDLAEAAATTPFTTLLAAFQLLLSRYTGQFDIPVGTPVAGRRWVETEGVIGFFVNTLVLRTKLDGNPSIREVLNRVREIALEAQTHQDLPFERLVEELQPERSLNHTPLFQVMLGFQNAPQQRETIPGLTVSHVEVKGVTAKFDLTLSMAEGEQGITGEIEYNADLFNPGTIDRLLEHFRALLEAMVDDPDQRLTEIEILSDAERRQMLVEWNDTQAGYPREQSLPQIFEARVEQSPDTVALVHDDQQLTYRELNRRANQLAHYLQELGVGPETRVGLNLKRTPNVIIAMLAVLKAGGAYFAQDVGQPRERLLFMLEDCGVKFLLTEPELAEELCAAPLQVISLNNEWKRISQFSAENPVTRAVPENLACLIYTSGSTGKPKGAMLTHGCIAFYARAGAQIYEITAADRGLQFASLGVDAPIEEIYPCLTQGGTLFLRDEEMMASARDFLGRCGQLGITFLSMPTAWFHVLTAGKSMGEWWDLAKDMRLICFGGEAVLPERVRELLAATDRVRLINGYGPTETTVVSTFGEYDHDHSVEEIGIGRPLPNTQIYIVDKSLRAVPVGVTGELLIGGDGVARGYLSRPDLTAEKFIPNPFATAAGHRVYRTGDHARYLPDGNIEFFGRQDHQVKIRGFRIETGEIEAVLRAHSAVKEAVVIAREERPGDKRLVAYVVWNDGAEGEAGAGALRKYLKDKLPGHMMPSFFVGMDEFPLTAYRKVDRLALPKPQGAVEWNQLYVAPRTPVEEMLVGIWANVLGVDHVGIEDNFFEIGGHSLLATQLISRVRETFGVELPLRALFEQATVAALAERVEQLWRGGSSAAVQQLSVVDRNGALPLSFAQQRLWFLDQLEPGSPLYNVPEAVRLSGPLDTHALERSINELIHRHESLRTRFVADASGAPAQVISDRFPFTLEVEDLSPLELRRLLDEEAEQGFDLAHGPLLRVRLFRLGVEDHVLAATMHHIISDEWSMELMTRELSALYDAFISGSESPLPELRLQYADYAVWQREWLQGEVLERELHYWRQQLTGAPAVIDMPTDRARPAVQTHRGAYQRVRFDAATTRGLKELSRRQNATLFMTVLAGFQALLSRWSGATDVVVGSPVAGRTQGATESVIGFFVNTLALRTDLSGNPTFGELLGRVREVCLGAYAHQEVPFEKLVEELGVERDLSRTPLFQVMLAWATATADEPELSGLRMERVEEDLSRSRAKFDLLLSLGEFGEQIGGTLEYNTDLYDAATIERLARHLERVMVAVADAEECRVGELPLLSEAERDQVVVEWNRRELYQVSGSVMARFEREVERRPEAIAVKFDQEEVSYGELNRRANQLAHYLRRHGVGPEARVGLLLNRSVEMVVSVLAVLKAGGAYVPLELAAPAERIAFMSEDSGCELLLTSKGESGQSGALHSATVIEVDDLWQEIAGEPETNLGGAVDEANIAYVIYTSGSTGKPKGVLVTHANVLRLLDATDHWFRFGSEDVWTMFHSYAFDFSVWELWGALLYGGRLVVVPYWVSRSPEAYFELLQCEQVTVLNQTPSAFRQLQPLLEETPVDRLRAVIFGGEALELSSLRSWYERYGDDGPQMVNMYGITETTVHVTYRLLGPADVTSGRSSLIGRRIPDLELYLLDERQAPAPVGVAGELYVGGGGVARGYLNRAELTAERFIPHPFSSEAGARLYRTGDLGRYLADGDIEYLGRVDQQVKIRGFRIETGEVAAALRSHEAVAEAVVIAWTDDGGEQRLVGYFVPRGELEIAELRSYLRERLPDYMAPAYLVVMDALPLTANGKLDRRRLPVPQTETLSSDYQAPTTPVEEKLAVVWANVLGTERVGVTDNFFALGGDSIRSVRVVALAREEGLQFSLQQLFQYQTIEELAAVLSEDASEQLTKSEPFSLVRAEDREKLGPEIEDAYPLSMLQAGMLFHSEYERDSTLYHNCSSYHVRAPFDESALRAALDHLLQRHAVLRTAFDLTSYSEPLQLVQRQATAPFEVDDISHLNGTEQDAVIAAWQKDERRRYIDWREAPLLRFHVHRRSAETFQFSFAEHHAILDGWSVAALLSELFGSYNTLLNGEAETEGTASRSAFRDFVALEQEALRSDQCRQYWREKLSGSTASSLSRWFADEPAEMRLLQVPVSAELSDRLKQIAENAGVPIKSVLLAAHLRVMSFLNGQPEVLIGLASHGRPEAIDAERVLGLFLNTLPFRMRLEGGSWFELFKETFASEREVLPQRYYPLAQIKIDEGGRPLFDTIFNFTHFRVLDVFNTATGVDVLEQSGFAETDFALAVDFSLNLGSTSQINLQLTGTVLSREQLEAIAGYYSKALTAIAADPHARYDLQPLHSEDELQRLLVEWNDTAAEYERDICVHQLFEQQVERTPHAIAVEFGTIQLTYQELNDRANQLAHYLRDCGVGAEVPVGICMERSAEMVVALLAILKAGGAYLPLDVDYPVERLSFMMADSGATVLITQSELPPALAEHQVRLVIPARDRELIGRYSTQNLPAVTTPQNLAYIIYTSGSTGIPKGSGITLRSINRLVRNTNYIQISCDDVFAQVSNSSFDAATFEIWGSLLHGARLQGISREVLLTPHAFEAALKAQGATAMFLTTALFNQMVRHNPGSFATMSHLLVGGDKVDVDAARTVLRSGAVPKRLLNGYGPTETTTFAATHEIDKLNDEADNVPIGRGIANTDLYVLDPGQHPVPLMTKGELYIGGDGLARGYLNRPELTAEKFVPHPFSTTPGERLYRTGDVVRWNTEGAVEYLGRVDHQVKIRGFRIETGEIETALIANERVREAVVIVREDEPGEKRLVAYVACDPEVTIGHLRSCLREQMPDYMIPSYFVLLNNLPLNANGKVDRSALPEPQPDEAVSSEAYVAPRTPTEQAIAEIWSRVLGMERVGINDNFFDLGGHSLLATQLISRIREDFALEMPLVHLFENPTVAALAQIVESIRWVRQDQAFAAAAGQEYEEGEL